MHTARKAQQKQQFRHASEGDEPRLMTEAIDQAQMQRALKALSFMRKIDFSPIPSLNDAVKSSIDELNHSLSSEDGVIKRAADVVGKAFQALRSRSTAPLKTPLGRAVDVAATISSGFGALPGIVDANVRDPGEAADKTLTDAVTGKAEAVQQLLRKAFSGGALDAERVADDIMHVKLETLANLAKRIKTDVGNRDALSLIDKAIKSKQTGEKPAEPQKASEPASRPEPSTPTTSTGTTKTNKEQTRALAKKMQQDAGVDEQTFMKVIQAVTRAGYVLTRKSRAAQ